MKVNFIVFLCVIFVIIIVGLFIELSYNKKHARMVILAPETMTIIKGKDVNCLDDLIIYNSENISLDKVIKKIPKSKRNKYSEHPIDSHMSKKFSKPFNDSYKEIKEGYGETMPVSLITKSAIGIADLANVFISEVNNTTPYRLLSSNEKKWSAFIDSNNIYLK